MYRLNWFSDPAHGWLRVPLALIVELGLADTISKYSYRQGNYGYLEEDRDATIFIMAAKDAGWELEFADSPAHYSDHDSIVRSFPSWTPPAATRIEP